MAKRVWHEVGLESMAFDGRERREFGGIKRWVLMQACEYNAFVL